MVANAIASFGDIVNSRKDGMFTTSIIEPRMILPYISIVPYIPIDNLIVAFQDIMVYRRKRLLEFNV
jgi:hypothetical protein